MMAQNPIWKNCGIEKPKGKKVELIHGMLKVVTLCLISSITLFSFALNEGHAYPAPKFKQVLLCSSEDATGSIYTVFYAIISGPSPEDVASFTATGPSGTFDLTSSKSWKELGLYYVHGYSQGTGIVDNGTYTFRVTDNLGRSATAVQDFTYDGTLPQVNPASMSPADGAYVGTTTPTLSFNPVAGAFYYQVTIQDYDYKAMWSASPTTTATAFTVPSGMLQPNTAYRWQVHAWDSDTNPQNRQSSSHFSFYTGTKGDPELNLIGLSSLRVGDSFQFFLNYCFARGVNVAPWDIDYFTATGPDSTVFNLGDIPDVPATRGYGFQFSAFNDDRKYLGEYPPTQSVPDGTYMFEIADKSGNTATGSVNYVYNPVPDFSTDSRAPAGNAYFDTDTPSFSWARVTGDPGDGSYLYSMRILDYAERIRWYDSPYSADTSFTLPAGLNLPKGNSYMWRVYVKRPASPGSTNSSNRRGSHSRTFTINAIAYVNKADNSCGGKSPCYTSIQTAIDAATTTSDIRIAKGSYTESIDLTTSKSLTLQGGWDSSFSTQTSNTTFIKAPKAAQGSLTLQELTVKP